MLDIFDITPFTRCPLFLIYISGNSITDLVWSLNGNLLCLVDIKISIPFNFPFQKRGHLKLNFILLLLFFTYEKPFQNYKLRKMLFLYKFAMSSGSITSCTGPIGEYNIRFRKPFS